MATSYLCDDRRRLQIVRDETTLNAIDYLEVLDADAPGGHLPQQTLLVHCISDVTALDTDNVRIEGGVRRTPILVEWAAAASAVDAALLTTDEQTYFAGLTSGESILVVRTDALGDFSTYTLRLVDGAASTQPASGFDPQLNAIRFSFKVECPSPFDCRPHHVCPPPGLAEPALDYLAKDYASFRRLMLDRMSVLMPDWSERSPADQMVTLVELLAYVGDRLSYYQDAVATEAYLGTARRRISVRRHARLLDYHMHDGCNARAWIALEVEEAGQADGFTLPAGTRLLAGHDAPTGALVLDDEEFEQTLDAGARVFETLHPLTLRSDHNELHFHTWGDAECCLPAGATRATLAGEHPDLHVGDLLLLEEVVGAETGVGADADSHHRQVVRLTRVTAVADPAFPDPVSGEPLPVMELEWSTADALGFPLCISVRAGEAQGGQLVENVSVARGNILLADHGLSVQETLTVPLEGGFRPVLAHAPLTHQGQAEVAGEGAVFDPAAPARAAMSWSTTHALPAIRLIENDDEEDPWLPQRDLLGSGRFARELIVETDEEGRGTLRCGDGVHGRRPTPGVNLVARYRVGTGRDGNVGAGAIVHVLLALEGVTRVRNPLPARGGADPESSRQVREYAPYAFRVQERAVTEADYAEVLQRRDDVQKAVADFRWTGSWHTAFVTADRVGGGADEPDYRAELRRGLERYRMAGIDLEVRRPVFVPLYIAMIVCVRHGYFAADVQRRLVDVFSRDRFFHPDRFTFGQPLYLSQLYAAAMDVDGVDHVDITHFRRWDRPAAGELEAGVLTVGPAEIVRLENDANFPEHGKLEVFMEGGL